MAFKLFRKKKQEVKDDEEASHTTPTKKVDFKAAVKKAPEVKVEVVAPKKAAPKKAAPKKVEVKATADIKVVDYRELMKTELVDKAAAAEARRRRHLGYN